jgi:hypothetical protein
MANSVSKRTPASNLAVKLSAQTSKVVAFARKEMAFQADSAFVQRVIALAKQTGKVSASDWAKHSKVLAEREPELHKVRRSEIGALLMFYSNGGKVIAGEGKGPALERARAGLVSLGVKTAPKAPGKPGKVKGKKKARSGKAVTMTADEMALKMSGDDAGLAIILQDVARLWNVPAFARALTKAIETHNPVKPEAQEAA